MITLANNLYTYRMSDQGKTWQAVGNAYNGSSDKNWGATDYRIHRIYSITRAICNGGEGVTFSDDSGETWWPKDKPAYCFNGMDFAQIAVGPTGMVYAAGVGGGGITFSKSYDGGQNWTTPDPVARFSGAASAAPVVGGHPYRTPTNANLAVSLATGALYVAWHQTEGTSDNVKFTASFDDGNTWSPPITVEDDTTGADQFVPGLAASPDGDVHLVFFDARNDVGGSGNTLDMYYAHLRIPPGATSLEGLHFEKNIRLTAQSFVPYLSRHQQQPFFLGDYIGITATNNEAVATFPYTINGRAELHAVIVGG
jgi:hypothetical protein